jgi:hypothetical protein
MKHAIVTVILVFMAFASGRLSNMPAEAEHYNTWCFNAQNQVLHAEEHNDYVLFTVEETGSFVAAVPMEIKPQIQTMFPVVECKK